MNDSSQSCAHLDHQLRWLGVRHEHNRCVYLFQCTGCGKTLSTHTLLREDRETGLLMKLTGPAHV